MRIKNLKFGLGMIIAGLLMLPAEGVFAQSGLGNPAGGGSLFCERDFSNYLSNGIDFDGEGFTDYWGDILDFPGIGWSRYSANYCHFADIDSLLQRIDKSRKQLRQAFYVCDSATVARVSNDYKEMSMELYYLRHFLDTKPFVGGRDAPQEVKDESVVKKPNFQKEFLDKFADNEDYFDQQTTLKLFNQFEAKYDGKIDSYKNCTDPNMDALRLKIEELKNTFTTIKKLADRLNGKIQQRKKASDEKIQANPGMLTAFSADNIGDAFKRAVDFRVNGENLSDPTVWENFTSGKSGLSGAVSDATSSDSTIRGSDGYVFNDVLIDLNKAQTRDDNLRLEAIYLAEMEMNYKETGGVGLDKAIEKLVEWQEIIRNTFPEMANLEKCTARIVAKQCGNK
jgi:hypothetical protein